MELSITSYIMLCIFGFIAAWVDSIAGGGGIITIPAYLAAGIPPQFTLGTNKLSASFSSFTSSLRYFCSQKTNLRLMLILAPFTLVGSIVGVRTILLINNTLLHIVLSIGILTVGLYSIFHPSLGSIDSSLQHPTKKSLWLGMLLSLALGFYDGFFGPGTGSFLMFTFIKLFGYDYLRSSANARFLNFISNITSLITFIVYGKVLFIVGIPVGICMIGGSWLGSHMAIKNGNKIVKPIFVIVTIAVAVKLIIDLL
ncbi:MAG: TSUP family transporter [Caldisericia bacterium]|nr:TSUP family transporter [Caldisericia bacterium]